MGGARGGYDGGKRKKRSKIHMAVDTPGCLLSLPVTPASGGSFEVEGLTRMIQVVTSDRAEIAYVDQGYTVARAAGTAAIAASRHRGIALEIVERA